MEVRKDFPKRVKALAESTPREAIANLLSALMPRVPVAVRKPAPYQSPLERPEYKEALAGYRQPDPMGRLRKRAPRVRKPKSREWKVLRPGAAYNHRRGTWRQAMVNAVINSNNELSALEWLSEIYGADHEFTRKGIDAAWCVEQGYITYNLSEGE